MEGLAREVCVQTRETHTLRDDRAGNNLRAVERSEYREPRLVAHFSAEHGIIQGLNNNVHVVELPRERVRIVVFVAFLRIRVSISCLECQHFSITPVP
jgi:hypothetical protein